MALIIVIFHSAIRNFGMGPLFVLMGSMQFFLIILTSSVYNLYFDKYIFSPGSSVLFTSTLFCILLVFHTESIKKVRSLIYGLLLSNIAITLLCYISLQQIYLDNKSYNVEFIKNIFNHDTDLFLLGTCLLYLDSIFLIILYELMNYKFKNKFLFLKILLPTSLVCLFDSVVYYSLNNFSDDIYLDLIIGNVIGKQITVVFFSVTIYLYLNIIGKKHRFTHPKKIKDVLKIFSF
ncbi:hypothetical protein ACFSX9_12055 [Flavobacterium ardleyense]|uniref:Vitamin uptake-like sensor domain-containing protein n=1 Tax=Flavobacterium ardleyense TaxID=2038737 RepID=A0ABW5Z9P3_9FLAO